MNGTKGRLLLLLKILEEKSDSEHYLRSQDLIDLLADMSISAERKTVYSDIEVLCELGYDIVKNGKKGYYLASRKFEQAELMLLADTVAASRFMTEKKSAELIGKIESLSSEYQSAKISRQITVTNRIKSMNESIYYSIDAIHEAIAAKKKISFKYISYASKRSKVFRNNGKPYIVSPYRLICDNENYYLLAGYSAHEDPLTTFRADKMVNVAILDENAEPAKINIGKYGATEVDFVVQKEGVLTYYQVTADMTAEETFEREMRPLRSIPDNYEKVVLTLDRFSLGNYDGIKVVNVIDWLLE